MFFMTNAKCFMIPTRLLNYTVVSPEDGMQAVWPQRPQRQISYIVSVFLDAHQTRLLCGGDYSRATKPDTSHSLCLTGSKSDEVLFLYKMAKILKDRINFWLVQFWVVVHDNFYSAEFSVGLWVMKFKLRQSSVGFPLISCCFVFLHFCYSYPALLTVTS